jgi:hypothetical protein
MRGCNKISYNSHSADMVHGPRLLADGGETDLKFYLHIYVYGSWSNIISCWEKVCVLSYLYLLVVYISIKNYVGDVKLL